MTQFWSGFHSGEKIRRLAHSFLKFGIGCTQVIESKQTCANEIELDGPYKFYLH